MVKLKIKQNFLIFYVIFFNFIVRTRSSKLLTLSTTCMVSLDSSTASLSLLDLITSLVRSKCGIKLKMHLRQVLKLSENHGLLNQKMVLSMALKSIFSSMMPLIEVTSAVPFNLTSIFLLDST